MGKKVLVDLSHPFGFRCPVWPYFKPPRIENIHGMAGSGVLSQRITTSMHVTTHTDAPGHVVQGGIYTHEVPLESYYGDTVFLDVSDQMEDWTVIDGPMLQKACDDMSLTDEDLEGLILIVYTGWSQYWGDNEKYFCYSPGFGRSSGEWFVSKKVKCVGSDTQALDHPLHTAIGPHGPGPIKPNIVADYKKRTGKKVIDEFPEWEPNHNIIFSNGIIGYENIGGDIAKVAGKRCKTMGFPLRMYQGDGSIVRLVAEIDETELNDVPSKEYKYGTH